MSYTITAEEEYTNILFICFCCCCFCFDELSRKSNTNFTCHPSKVGHKYIFQQTEIVLVTKKKIRKFKIDK